MSGQQDKCFESKSVKVLFIFHLMVTNLATFTGHVEKFRATIEHGNCPLAKFSRLFAGRT